MANLGFPASDIPLYANHPAVRTPFGIMIAPGANVAAYVGSQIDANDSYVFHNKRVDTLDEGLARCRSGITARSGISIRSFSRQTGRRLLLDRR